MKVIALVSALGLVLGTAASAEPKSYTPAELRDMVQSGRYPEQGDVATTIVDKDYASCIVTLEGILSAIRPNYPTATIVSTNILRTEKLWTNDGAMTATCDAIRKKLIITRAPYR